MRALLLAPLALAACSPDLLGTWRLDTYEGGPTSVSTTYEGCAVTSTLTVVLDLDAVDGEDTLGAFTYDRVDTWDCPGDHRGEGGQSLAGDVTAEPDGRDDWELDIDLEERGSFDLECTRGPDALECEDEARREYGFVLR